VVVSPPLLGDVAHVHPRPGGGVLVVPFVLPLEVPEDALHMTVAEWLGVDRAPSA
jgi:hypothetical protein